VRLSLIALAAAGALALAGVDDRAGADESLSVVMADGTLAHDNSRDGAAILTASSVWPGWSGSGDVTITNSGTAGSWLRLSSAAVDDLPGPAGGLLSQKLVLTVEDVTVPGFAVPVYVGLLGTVGEQWLGRLEPSESRTYRFRTGMPGASDDNAFQESAVSVRFEWAVSDTDPGAVPPVDPPVDPTDPVIPDPEDKTPTEVVPDGPPIVVTPTALGLTLAVPITQNPLKTRRLVALAMCSRRCTATFTGKLKAGPRSTRSLGLQSRRLRAGVKRKVKLLISRESVRHARRKLSRGSEVRAVVRVIARDRAGRKARAKQRIRLVPARR